MRLYVRLHDGRAEGVVSDGFSDQPLGEGKGVTKKYIDEFWELQTRNPDFSHADIDQLLLSRWWNEAIGER